MKKTLLSVVCVLAFVGCTGPVTGHTYTEDELIKIYEAGKYAKDRIEEAKKRKESAK